MGASSTIKCLCGGFRGDCPDCGGRGWVADTERAYGVGPMLVTDSSGKAVEIVDAIVMEREEYDRLREMAWMYADLCR